MFLRLFPIRCLVIVLMAATACVASPVSLTLNSSNSTLDGYGIGWLNFTVDGTGQGLLLMCDDTTHEVNYGLDYTYNYSNLGDDLTNNTTSDLEFGSLPDAVTDYKAAGYLAWEYHQADPTGTNATFSADYNIAIWTLFDPTGLAARLDLGDPTPANYQAAALSFVANPFNAEFLIPIYQGTAIYTPNPSMNNGSFSQEFFRETPPDPGDVMSPTPEPGAVVLVGGGLVLILLSRKIRSSRA
jgi:hypothetical protein